MIVSVLLLALPARGASLDGLEVGGPWGSPTATDGTAVWWNPAGLAAGRGTRIEIEGAPTFATVTFQRAEPHGGQDIYRLSGVVPYVGIASDLGVHGLGIGAALAIPTVRGGAEVEEPGSGAYHMRDGSSRAIWALVGGGYEVADRFAFGGAVALVHSQWTARVNSDSIADLNHAIAETGNESGYTDEDLEDPRYAAQTEFDLSDTVYSWSAGVRVQIVPTVAVGAAFIRGVDVDNTGDVTITFSCPPEEDTLGRLGIESNGLCYTEVAADASVAYELPSRVHAGVVVQATPALRLEAMGGWVQWSVYTDFDIGVHDLDVDDPEARELLEQDRQWARDNENSAWAGLDAKGTIAEKWTLGGRLLYDAAAVPDAAVSTNNYDANAWMLTMLAAWRPVRPIEIGVSWTHHFLAERDITGSAFGMTIDSGTGRYEYPHANGVYNGQIDRIGLAARAAF